jgi:hypothetical protein
LPPRAATAATGGDVEAADGDVPGAAAAAGPTLAGFDSRPAMTPADVTAASAARSSVTRATALRVKPLPSGISASELGSGVAVGGSTL